MRKYNDLPGSCIHAVDNRGNTFHEVDNRGNIFHAVEYRKNTFCAGDEIQTAVAVFKMENNFVTDCVWLVCTEEEFKKRCQVCHWKS